MLSPPQEYARTCAAPDAAALKGLTTYIQTTLMESEADFATEAVRHAVEASARAAEAAQQAVTAAVEAQRHGALCAPASPCFPIAQIA